MTATNQTIKSLLILVFVAATLSLSGCAKTGWMPRGDVLDAGELAKAFWDVETDLRGAPPKGKLTVAIVEFNVEFAERPGEADFSSSMKLELPGVLYRAFVDVMPEFDRIPVPLERLADSSQFAKLEGVGLDEISLSDDVPERLYPVDGLQVLVGPQDNLNNAALKIAEEIGADFGLRVLLRVGVRDGRASIEKGSWFQAVSARGRGRATSRLSFVATVDAVDRDDDGGGAINSTRFVAGIQRLFRPYIALVISAVTSGAE